MKHLDALTASPISLRLKAFLYDLVLFTGTTLLLSVFLVTLWTFGLDATKSNVPSATNQVEYGLYLVKSFNELSQLGILIAMVWPIIRSIRKNGQTAGRELNHIRIVSLSGKRASALQHLIRWITKVITVYIGMGAGLIFILVTPSQRAFHEMISGTRTIVLKTPAALTESESAVCASSSKSADQ